MKWFFPVLAVVILAAGALLIILNPGAPSRSGMLTGIVIAITAPAVLWLFRKAAAGKK